MCFYVITSALHNVSALKWYITQYICCAYHIWRPFICPYTIVLMRSFLPRNCMHRVQLNACVECSPTPSHHQHRTMVWQFVRTSMSNRADMVSRCLTNQSIYLSVCFVRFLDLLSFSIIPRHYGVCSVFLFCLCGGTLIRSYLRSMYLTTTCPSKVSIHFP
jgi:hypothetical protein